MFDCNYVIQESVVSRTNQDGTVVIMKMDEGNTFFKINGVAAEVWVDLSKSKNINQIIRDIVGSYNETSEKIEEDVKNLIEQLLAKDLILKI
jgi:hypothetical protein